MSDPEFGRVTRFTPRQQVILSLVAAGLSDKEIAVRLCISRHTVRSHLDRLFRDHQLNGRAMAVAVWLMDLHDVRPIRR
jgi:DNA-binding NarL/FixJ family response regulator